jgi:hypothetical protein
VLAQAIAAISLTLLGVAGTAKLVDPDPTRGALDAAGLPASRLIVRGLGIVEIGAAGAGLALGGRWVIPAVVLYLGFTVFTTLAVRSRIPVQSCGCFGREDTPPSIIHVVFNAVATIALGVAATADLVLPWSEPLLDLLTYVGYVLMGAYLSYLLLTRLPQNLRLAANR